MPAICIAIVVLALVFAASDATGTELPCPNAPLVAAYAHNDYENEHPLRDALRLGYRGIEADVFLVEGEIRVAHDRGGTRPGRTLQSLYLEPLRAIAAECGRITSASEPFWMNVEIKEESRATYDTLCAVLAQYSDLLWVVEHGEERPGAVLVTLVGWHPPIDDLARESRRWVHVQQQVVTRSMHFEPSPVVRLVSLNYGKTIRWSGRAPMPSSAQGWLDALQFAKGSAPGRIARVYNVPPRAEIYRALYASGVDLIGTEDLEASERVLRGLAPEPESALE